MPRRPRAATVLSMVRLVLVVAVIAGGVVLLKGRLDNATGGVPATPPVSSAQVPPQFRSILAKSPDPIAILRQRGALPGLGAISRLAGRATDEAPPEPAPFADVGSRAELRSVRSDIRRDIAALNRLSEGDGATASEVERTLAEV